jgi:hypothetical protein
MAPPVENNAVTACSRSRLRRGRRPRKPRSTCARESGHARRERCMPSFSICGVSRRASMDDRPYVICATAQYQVGRMIVHVRKTSARRFFYAIGALLEDEFRALATNVCMKRPAKTKRDAITACAADDPSRARRMRTQAGPRRPLTDTPYAARLRMPADSRRAMRRATGESPRVRARGAIGCPVE